MEKPTTILGRYKLMIMGTAVSLLIAVVAKYLPADIEVLLYGAGALIMALCFGYTIVREGFRAYKEVIELFNEARER